MNTQPIENSDYKGFFEIPGYPTYLISKDGQVLSKKSKRFLIGSKNTSGYINIRITESKVTLTWGLHRLLCFVFKNPGTDIKDLVVNHIDGVKDNNNLDNLEWVTYQGNQEHAGSMGLTLKCLSVSIRNVRTNEVLKFPSIIKCADFLGVSKDTVNWRVKAGEHRVFPDGYQYRLGTSDDPWFTPEITDMSYLNGDASKPIKVRFLALNKIKVFSKIKDYSHFSGASVSTISNWLKLKDQPVLPGCVQIKYLSDNTPWRIVEDLYGELEAFTGKRMVCLTNAISGEERIFTSCVDCCKEMNLNPSALTYRLKTNGKKIFSDGYRYSYFTGI